MGFAKAVRSLSVATCALECAVWWRRLLFLLAKSSGSIWATWTCSGRRARTARSTTATECIFALGVRETSS
ncbi:hypothetical protein PR001_g32355 [Phytophthora rubi]|uniref:Uncharacterized protein n=1 Tax=Phytophthora rubi TaxID=129364 RepID=A0A6A3GLY6_9STRA|nr:hypothetical protein PR001_g32355 [Phytophthora rubi]